jgi:adenine-specific DNA-methyltransferase
MVSPERVRLFESRKDAFQKDEILQENIILKARKAGNSAIINISVSKGVDDLDNPVGHRLSTSQALYSAGKGRILRLPVNNLDVETIDIVEQWEGSIHKYGLQISTGPVVPFRAEDLISGTKHRSKGFVPLIWMQNGSKLARTSKRPPIRSGRLLTRGKPYWYSMVWMKFPRIYAPLYVRWSRLSLRFIL